MADSDQNSSQKPLKTPLSSGQERKSLFLAAFGMGVGTLLSRILGLVRDAMLAALFGKITTDAYAIGFRLPNFFRRVLGEGALSVSFIPNYLSLKEENPQKAEQLKNTMFSFLFILSGVLSGLGIIFLDKILYWILYGGSTQISQDHFNLSVQMGRWMFAYLFLVTQFAYFMSVLNANKKFIAAGMAPAFFNLGFILCMFLPKDAVGFEGQQLALGVMFGGLLQVVVVALSFFKSFGFPKFNFNFGLKEFKKTLLATVPSLMGIGVLQMISIININFCSRVGEGANSFLYFADRIMELPQALIAVSIGTAMLPNLSVLWSRGERKDFDRTLVESMRVYLFFALPAAAGLIFLSLPITQLLFQRGRFDLSQSIEVAKIVQVYGLVLVVSGLSRIVLPIFYSFKNTWFPATISIFVLLNHFIIGNVLVEKLGLQGVALTTLSSGVLNLLLLLIGLKIFIKRSYIFSILKAALDFIPSVVLLSGFLYFAMGFVSMNKTMTSMIITLSTIFFAVFVYYLCSLLFKVEESKLILSLVKRLIKRKV